jgi:hypothetical protein
MTTMPVRVTATLYSCPAHTLASTPFVAFPSVGWAWYHKIIVRVPPGHNGQTGYAFLWNGRPIAPWVNSSGGVSYYVANNEIDEWPFDMEIDTKLSFQMINSDIFAHTVYVRMFYTPISLVTQSLESTAVQSIVQTGGASSDLLDRYASGFA